VKQERLMRNTKACPKCKSHDIVVIPSSVGAYVGAVIPMIRVSHYLCGSCGFIEEWVDDPKELERIKKKYGDG
jgi:hypothetical protein